VSEPAPAQILLIPSRLRRRLLLAAAAGQGALAVVLGGRALGAEMPPGTSGWQLWIPAMICLLAMAASLCSALRPRQPSYLVLVPSSAAAAVQDAPRRARGRHRPESALPWRDCPAPVALAGARAVNRGRTRIVMRAGSRSVAIWRDATDRDTFRRLAAMERWRLAD
jgi:hypothetical protein